MVTAIDLYGGSRGGLAADVATSEVHGLFHSWPLPSTSKRPRLLSYRS